MIRAVCCGALGVVGVCVASSAALGQGASGPVPSRPARVDASGRWLAQQPPDRGVDTLHMTLDLDLGAFDGGEALGRAVLDLAAVGAARDRIELDARGLEIEGVWLNKRPAGFETTPERLIVLADPPLTPDRIARLEVRYRLPGIGNPGVGLSWTRGKVGASSPTGRAPQLHAQGQSVFNSSWFPCRDAPDERLTTTLRITAPDGFEVLANGRLAERAMEPDGRVRWTWLQDRPHPVYLVTLVVGRYEVVDLGGMDSARPGLAMPVYAPIGRAERTARVLERTPEMMAFLEDYLDEPYPWAQYAQAVCRDFRWGGMENTGATVLHGDIAEATPGTQDDLVMHELAHQWLGNLVTCASWEHLWLNEGWATFAELLWVEHTEGSGSERALTKRRGWLIPLAVQPQRTGPEWAAMRTPYFVHPDDVFEMREDPYTKGAWVLHMLRSELGDALFRRVAIAWIDTHKGGSADTEDFRRVAERVSGRSLEWFFDQWVDRPGLPYLTLTPVWEPQGDGRGRLTLTAEQTQPIDRLNPAFRLRVPVELSLADGSTRRVMLETSQTQASMSIELPARPTSCVPDPEVGLLAVWSVRPTTDRRLGAGEISR